MDAFTTVPIDQAHVSPFIPCIKRLIESVLIAERQCKGLQENLICAQSVGKMSSNPFLMVDHIICKPVGNTKPV